ncbi:MAG TPA: flagellar hook-length control protein FliK [Limnobacter sp.]|uniref:flagellar hook-length control protein FliK n=1 Tax=Limnobacter sp. TaxID=2003368 RepID=UPI002EDB783A
MTTGTSSVNTTMKVQNTAAKTTAKTAVDASSVDFSSLFSSARLNSFESQMRDALGKDTVGKEPSPNKKEARDKAPTMPDPQAMVWAQHSWMAEQQQRPAIAAVTPKTDNTAGQAQPIDSSNKTAADTSPAQSPTTQAADNGQKADNNSTATAQTSKTADTQQASPAVPTQQESSAATMQTRAGLDNGDSIPQTTVNVDTRTESTGKSPTTAESAPQLASDVSSSTHLMQGSSHEPGTRKASSGDDNQQSLKLRATVSAEVQQTGQTADARSTATAIDPAALSRLPIQAALAAQTQAANRPGQELPLDELSIKAGDNKLTTANLNPALGNLPGQSAVARGTAPAVGIRTPVNQPGFAKELGQTVNWALGKQLSTVELRVNPESFGPMNLKIVQKGQELHITIRTQDESSANLMAQAVSGLKETMAQNGVQVNQVTVQHSQGFNHGQSAGDSASAQTAHQGQQGQQSSGRRSGSQADGEAMPSDTQQTSASRSNAAPGGLDLFA